MMAVQLSEERFPAADTALRRQQQEVQQQRHQVVNQLSACVQREMQISNMVRGAAADMQTPLTTNVPLDAQAQEAFHTVPTVLEPKYDPRADRVRHPIGRPPTPPIPPREDLSMSPPRILTSGESAILDQYAESPINQVVLMMVEPIKQFYLERQLADELTKAEGKLKSGRKLTRGTVETCYTPAMYNVKELEMVVVSDLNKLCHRDKIKVNDRDNKTQLLEKLIRYGRHWWLETIADFQAPTVSPPACAIHGCEMKAERDVKANKAKLNEMYRWSCPHARCTHNADPTFGRHME